MRKRCVILGLAVCMLFLSGCRKETSGGENAYHIYYLDTEEVQLVEESCEIKNKTPEGRIKEVLALLQETPDTIGYKSVFISKVDVLDWELKTTKLDLYFNAAYASLDTTSEVLLRAAVVQSLVQVPGVSYVRFYVDGTPLTDRKGNAVGYMRGEDFVQNTGSSLHSYQTADLKLYFANSTGDSLVPEQVSVRYNSNMSIEKLIVEQLVKGPSGSDNRPVIPAEAKVLGVSVKDRICYVNFDEGFLNIAEQVNPKVTIYSLVNSIVEGGEAVEVQILVNGETNITYQETVDLSKPLSEDRELIRTEAD